MLILSPVVLSAWFPALVAWFVLSFDFYWFYKAVVVLISVSVTYLRIREVEAADWSAQLGGLVDLPARGREIEDRIGRIRVRVRELDAGGRHRAARGGRRELDRLERELVNVRRLLACGIQPLDPRTLVQCALIPTYTEPYEKLEATLQALIAADWPRERKLVAIITRETDVPGRENVALLQARLGEQFARFFHIVDPLEPGVVLGKSSAMAYGGRWLHAELVKLGYDPSHVIVTDLDADYRVHPQYFTYLAHRFATDPDRYHRLYQPIPMFHNNLWQVPLAVRLTAVSATHVQMWRSLAPERLVSFSSYAVCLRTVHEVGYWATDAIPEDSRFYWKSFFTYAGTFRAEPLFIPIFGDAVRARTYPRTLYQQYTQIRRWAWGVTDIPYYIRQALDHREIPLRVRLRRLSDLWYDHINWAIAPYVLIFGSSLPLFISDFFHSQFSQTTLGHNLPVYAGWMLTAAFFCLMILIFVEDRIAPPRPESWGIIRRALVYVQWLTLPAVGMIFSNLPALEAQTRLMTGRRLEYRVTEKA